MTLELKRTYSVVSVLKKRIKDQLQELKDLEELKTLSGNKKGLGDILNRKINARKKTLLKNKQKYINASKVLEAEHRKFKLSELRDYELNKQEDTNLLKYQINLAVNKIC